MQMSRDVLPENRPNQVGLVTSTGIAMFHSAVLKMAVVGTKQTLNAGARHGRFGG